MQTVEEITKLLKSDIRPNADKLLKVHEKETKELGDLERKLTKNYGLAKKDVDKGRDAMAADAAEVDESEILEQWAVLETYVDSYMKQCKAELVLAGTLHSKAILAVSLRDAKALQSAVKELQALDVMTGPAKYLRTKAAKLWKEHDPKKLSKDLQQQVVRDRAKFEKNYKEFEKLEADAKKLLKQAQALKLAPVDHKKAATVLKIPKTHVAKLQKALALDESRMRKSLDALAKELKLKTKSKDMIKALKKAKIL